MRYKAFKPTILKDVCDEITVGYVGPMSTEYKETGVLFLRSLNIKPFRLDFSDIKFISTEFNDKISKSSLKEGDVVVVRTGLPGTSCVIPKGFNLLNCSDLVVVRPNRKLVNSHFLSYFFNTVAKKYIDDNVVGAIQQHFNIGSAKEMIINLPDLQDQNKIEKVLNEINQKIELNNRINVELEGMAKLIYDYWFVQFDFPDENNKPYKTSGGKMVWNTELKREIPEGWSVKELKKIASTGSGGTPLSTRLDYYENGNIPWINSGEVNKPFIVKAEKFISEAGLINSSAKMFRKGTILMAMYGATAGKVSMIDIEACTNQAICGINPNYDYYDTFVKIGLEDLYKYLVNLSSGSARDNLSQDKIRALKFIMPSEELLKEFHKKVNSSMLKILMNLKENQKLTELRDWLLPMLMNGQVRVAGDGGEMGMAADRERVEYNATRKT